jgi:succinate dehydrogenase hydrophobic anchor subunit
MSLSTSSPGVGLVDMVHVQKTQHNEQWIHGLSSTTNRVCLLLLVAAALVLGLASSQCSKW